MIYFIFCYTFLQQIGQESKNGIITRYRITSQVNDTHSPPQFIENPSTTSHLVPVNNKYSTKILLNVATEVGFSTKSDSSLIVPPLGQGKLGVATEVLQEIWKISLYNAMEAYTYSSTTVNHNFIRVREIFARFARASLSRIFPRRRPVLTI